MIPYQERLGIGKDLPAENSLSGKHRTLCFRIRSFLSTGQTSLNRSAELVLVAAQPQFSSPVKHPRSTLQHLILRLKRKPRAKTNTYLLARSLRRSRCSQCQPPPAAESVGSIPSSIPSGSPSLQRTFMVSMTHTSARVCN